MCCVAGVEQPSRNDWNPRLVPFEVIGPWPFVLFAIMPIVVGTVWALWYAAKTDSIKILALAIGHSLIGIVAFGFTASALWIVATVIVLLPILWIAQQLGASSPFVLQWIGLVALVLWGSVGVFAFWRWLSKITGTDAKKWF